MYSKMVWVASSTIQKCWTTISYQLNHSPHIVYCCQKHRGRNKTVSEKLSTLKYAIAELSRQFFARDHGERKKVQKVGHVRRGGPVPRPTFWGIFYACF